MGKLQQLAEQEQREREARAEKVGIERYEERRRLCEEMVQPVADYLSKWSGEEIDSSMLKPSSASGPPQWDITIDGFKLRVQALGKPPKENLAVDIDLESGHGLYRPVFTPGDLLAKDARV